LTHESGIEDWLVQCCQSLVLLVKSSFWPLDPNSFRPPFLGRLKPRAQQVQRKPQPQYCLRYSRVQVVSKATNDEKTWIHLELVYRPLSYNVLYIYYIN
jgi:hypothetical protein